MVAGGWWVLGGDEMLLLPFDPAAHMAGVIFAWFFCMWCQVHHASVRFFFFVGASYSARPRLWVVWPSIALPCLALPSLAWPCTPLDSSPPLSTSLDSFRLLFPPSTQINSFPSTPSTRLDLIRLHHLTLPPCFSRLAS